MPHNTYLNTNSTQMSNRCLHFPWWVSFLLRYYTLNHGHENTWKQRKNYCYFCHFLWVYCRSWLPQKRQSLALEMWNGLSNLSWFWVSGKMSRHVFLCIEIRRADMNRVSYLGQSMELHWSVGVWLKSYYRTTFIATSWLESVLCAYWGLCGHLLGMIYLKFT